MFNKKIRATTLIVALFFFGLFSPISAQEVDNGTVDGVTTETVDNGEVKGASDTPKTTSTPQTTETSTSPVVIGLLLCLCLIIVGVVAYLVFMRNDKDQK